MSVFMVILSKIFPLYLLIVLGFIAGKILKVKRESIAPLLIYLISPVVVLNAILSTELTVQVLSLPFIFWMVSCLICLMALRVGGLALEQGPQKNIMAFACGSGNTGYFGLPVALFLFGEASVATVIIAGFGMVLFENTLGFFITARGHHTAQESLMRVLKLPTLYAFSLGIILNFLGVRMQKPWTDLALNFRGAYAILGMMMIGLGVATLKTFQINMRFSAISFCFKFMVGPILIYSLILLDQSFFHIFSENIHAIAMLMAIVPLPANAVAVATELNTEPETVGMTVLLSTLFGLAYIPLVVAVLGLGV